MSASMNHRPKNRFAVVCSAVFVLMLSVNGSAQTVSQPPQPIYGIGEPIPNTYFLAPVPIRPVPPVINYGQPLTRRSPFPTPNAYPNAPILGGPVPYDANQPNFGTLMAPKQGLVESTPMNSVGNLRLVISERFLNRLIAKDEQKPGEVRDNILGADVTGRQTTSTQLRFDLLPDGEKMRGVMLLNGTTHSETTGVTPQAMVDVASDQQFIATKDVYFDGTNFSTRHAVVHVRASNQNLGAVTPLSGTLLGGIADRIAYRVAERRKPAAEAATRDRVAERVYPEFDQQTDKQLAAANGQLEGTVRRKLREWNLMPTQQLATSTDSYMTYSAQFGEEASQSSTSPLESMANKDEGAQLFIHQSLLNGMLSRFGLRGLKTTDKEIKALFAPYEYKSTAYETQKKQSSIAMPGLENLTTNIEFDDVDPVRIQVEKNVMNVVLRASFRPAGQNLLPPLIVTIPYTTELIDDKIVIIPGAVKVAPQSKEDSEALAGIALKMITEGIESSLLTLGFDRGLPASLWNYGGEAPKVMGVQSQDGWALISIR